ncbi:hypothetical protein [Nocardioides humi]|uniref:Uncharacterized protein n=1 Tax=Nocardioides humi TaxID=449461 RepID=A0ABN1ZU94_9ACTN|nr:hypothetical protein [Nocardioides humi]
MTFTVDPAALRRAAHRLDEEAGELRARRTAVAAPDAGALTTLVRLALATCTDGAAEVEAAFTANAAGLRYVARTAADTDDLVAQHLLDVGVPLWSS